MPNTTLDPQLVDAAMSSLERETAWEARDDGMRAQHDADEARATKARRDQTTPATAASVVASKARSARWMSAMLPGCTSNA